MRFTGIAGLIGVFVMTSSLVGQTVPDGFEVQTKMLENAEGKNRLTLVITVETTQEDLAELALWDERPLLDGLRKLPSNLPPGVVVKAGSSIPRDTEKAKALWDAGGMPKKVQGLTDYLSAIARTAAAQAVREDVASGRALEKALDNYNRELERLEAAVREKKATLAWTTQLSQLTKNETFLAVLLSILIYLFVLALRYLFRPLLARMRARFEALASEETRTQAEGIVKKRLAEIVQSKQGHLAELNGRITAVEQQAATLEGRRDRLSEEVAAAGQQRDDAKQERDRLREEARGKQALLDQLARENDRHRQLAALLQQGSEALVVAAETLQRTCAAWAGVSPGTGTERRQQVRQLIDTAAACVTRADAIIGRLEELGSSTTC